jgi:hypothetical protein
MDTKKRVTVWIEPQDFEVIKNEAERMETAISSLLRYHALKSIYTERQKDEEIRIWNRR